MRKHIVIDTILWMTDTQYNDLKTWCAQNNMDKLDWATETLHAALQRLSQQNAISDQANIPASYGNKHLKRMIGIISSEGKVLVINSTEIGSNQKIPEHQLFYALEDTGDTINGIYLYDYVPGQDMDCHSLNYHSLIGEISPEHLPKWAHAKLTLMHGYSTEFSFSCSAEIVKELENVAKYEVDAAVRKGLEDRVTDIYILKPDDLSENLNLEPDKQIIFDKLAMDALRAHPEVKGIELTSDGHNVFVSFHQPFEQRETTHNTDMDMTDGPLL